VVVVEPCVQPKLMADDAGCRIARHIGRERTSGCPRRVLVMVCIDGKHRYLLGKTEVPVDVDTG
jgi:hypothetical protein